MSDEWIIAAESVSTFTTTSPAVVASLPRPPVGTVATEVMPWELRVGDIVPFDDCIGRPIADIHAVGPGNRARRLTLPDLPPLTTRRKLRVYRALQTMSA